MAPPSRQRAVFSWILLLVIALAIGWITSHQKDPTTRPFAFSSPFLVEHEGGSARAPGR